MHLGPVKMIRKLPRLVIYSQRQYIYRSQKRCCDIITLCRYVKKVGKRYLFWLGPQGRTSLCNVYAHNFIECPHPPPGYSANQRAKKVVSDSPGLVDFAIGLVIFVLNLPDGQVLSLEEIQITEVL